ncbi:hypothetical protein CONLIGDRAFT_84105 [Coniochaeta ligniaria NRRL 30616]|uniref:Uncharacterized protein n=1 Tax=Coniochaeta ligniaria NRRL 30616 TaxID=1408157 RepID=A0A1J7J5V3_9PEZI|nr:hypothetical protein CONLIGDRAFT_84105 [Coniochaeta ligniaria NRRL 30616]
MVFSWSGTYKWLAWLTDVYNGGITALYTNTQKGWLLHFPGVGLHHYDTTTCFSAFGAFFFFELRAHFTPSSTMWTTKGSVYLYGPCLLIMGPRGGARALRWTEGAKKKPQSIVHKRGKGKKCFLAGSIGTRKTSAAVGGWSFAGLRPPDLLVLRWTLSEGHRRRAERERGRGLIPSDHLLLLHVGW